MSIKPGQAHLSRKLVGGTTWVDMNLGVSNTLYPPSDSRVGQGDSHRTAAVGVCPIDQTIHISFDQHGGNLRYIKSVPGAAIVPDAQWTTNLMNPERKYLVPGTDLKITYPQFTRNDDGGLIFGYRIGGSTRGNRWVNYYNGSAWSPGKLLSEGDHGSTAANFHYYSGTSYQHGKLYSSGTVRPASVGYNRGAYFGIFPRQDGLISEFARLDGVTKATPLDTKAEQDFLLVASPSVAADQHVWQFDCAVTVGGDVYLANGDFTYRAKQGETNFTPFSNVSDGIVHGVGDRIFASSHNNATRDKIHSTSPGQSSWTEEYAGPQRAYQKSVSVAYKNKIIGLFLANEGSADMKKVYCREYDLGVPIPQYPFRGDRQRIPGTVQAEYFDMGGQNVSYYDVTPARGGDPTFRPLETVDCTSSYVGGIDAGEWMEYGVEVTNSGSYQISLVASCITNGRTARVSIDGTQVAQFAIPDTASLGVYQTVTVSNVPFIKGTYILRLSTDTGGFNLDSIQFSGVPINNAPSISAIADQTILANTNTGPLAFTIGDEATAASALMLTKMSSNTNLVPLANIVFGGSDSNRTVTVTPLANQSGSTIISIIVSDGSLSATNSFTLTVWPPGTVVGAVTNSTPGTVMWTCPPGVTNVQVECWGGGGAGGSSRTAGAGAAYVAGGGGAGGAYARKTSVPVTPGTGYALTIGAAVVALDPATCAGGDRVNGADTGFTGDVGVSVLAKGGQGGECSVYTGSSAGGYGGAGGLGSTAGCLSDGAGFVFAGGNGFTAATKGGSGGAGAGNAGAGGDAYVTTDDTSSPGAGGVEGGGGGGLGANGNLINGGDGASPGGGGGGARTGRFVATTDPEWRRAGGVGGLGQIILTYVQLPAVEPPTLGHSLSGGNWVLSWSGNGFKLQSRTNLTSGTWSDVPGGNVSPVNVTPALPVEFFRLTNE